MSNPFWTLIAGPAAVAVYQVTMKDSVLNKESPNLDDSQSRTVVNTILLPLGVGYAGAYAAARFTGIAPLFAAAAGAAVSYLYYNKYSTDIAGKLNSAENTIEKDLRHIEKDVLKDL